MIPFTYILLIICFLQSTLSVFSILNPIDFLALQSIKKSLHDIPGSNFLSSWDFTSDPCNFPGVYCESNRVISLNLGDPRAGSPGLTGHLDPAIGKLSALTEFSIVPGKIYGSLPESISRLRNLRFLALSRNYLSGPIPGSWGRLRNLRTLDISYNQLNGHIPGSIGSIPSLTNVLLCHNHLSGSIPWFVSRSLSRIDLKHNDLSGSIAPGSFPPSLQYLSLSWNRLSGPVDRLLNRLNRLTYLDMSLNQFSGFIPVRIFSFPITNLQLQRNQFIGPVKSVSQVMIPTVDLSHNKLSGTISPMFSTVQTLYLNNNRFTGRVPGSFVERLLAANIQLLYLQHNYLTGIEINPTADIPASSSLCLQFNCMVPPVQTPCPLRAGKQRVRPAAQCKKWKG